MGGDLLNLITQDRQLPETAVKSFASELVAGLQYLHANGILYCDLKPANILIDEFGSLKYADFGLARRIPTSEMVTTRQIAPGSPHYMAPELFEQPAIHSFASDFWALGCLLYELKTGRQPFTHTNYSELARMIQTEAVALPVPGCEMSATLCNLIDRLLTKDPYQRITWDELIDHPFWDESQRLTKGAMPYQEFFEQASPAALEQELEQAVPVALRQEFHESNAPHSAPPAIRQAPRRRVNLNALFDQDGESGSGLRRVSKLIFAAADCRVRAIIDKKKLDGVHAMELLPFEAVVAEKLLSCPAETLEGQLKEIYVSLKSPNTDTTTKLSVLTYLHSLCGHARLAHVIVNSSLLKLLVRLLTQEVRSSGSKSPMIPVACVVLGVLFRFATFIAPSSPGQFQTLIKTLIRVVHDRSADVDGNVVIDESELRSRPLALACLGELLFYISTQQDWELPMEGIDCILTCLEDSDLDLRYYALRTLENMFILCADDFLATLLSEEIMLALIRGLQQYVTPEFDDRAECAALRTTTTEILAQVLRYLRMPSKGTVYSRLKRSVMLFFSKPDFLNAVWQGVLKKRGFIDLNIASLNVINAFLDMKLETEREAEAIAIKSSRTLFLERIIGFPAILQLLRSEDTGVVNDTKGKNAETLNTLRAKTLLLVCLGIQLNRAFLLTFVQHKTLQLVEEVLSPVAIRMTNQDTDSSSPPLQVSPLEVYVTQCAMNVCKLAIKMALKLGADCFSSHDNGLSNNSEPRISATPFELLQELLDLPTCRLQLLNYFEVNDNKQFTFFLRLMSKLLASFANQAVTTAGGDVADESIGSYVSKILVDLFEFAVAEAVDIVLVEEKLLFSQLLPAVMDNICSPENAGENCEAVAMNCIRILHVVLLDFEYGGNKNDDVSYGVFLRSHLLPHLNSVLSRGGFASQQIAALIAELLRNVLSSDRSLLSVAAELDVVSTLAGISDYYPQLSHYTTELDHMLQGYEGTNGKDAAEIAYLDRPESVE